MAADETSVVLSDEETVTFLKLVLKTSIDALSITFSTSFSTIRSLALLITSSCCTLFYCCGLIASNLRIIPQLVNFKQSLATTNAVLNAAVAVICGQ